MLRRPENQWEASKIKQIYIVCLLVSVLFCGGCNHNLKQEIKTYRGDGKIRYLKAPLLGVAGCAIEMSHFDLSKNLHLQYDFTSIPSGSNYIVFLIVPKSSPLQDILQGTLSVQIKKDGKVVIESMSKIGDMRNSSEPQKNRFYFSGEKQVVFDVDNSTSQWTIIVNSYNTFLKEPVEAYVEISTGGFK